MIASRAAERTPMPRAHAKTRGSALDTCRCPRTRRAEDATAAGCRFRDAPLRPPVPCLCRASTCLTLRRRAATGFQRLSDSGQSEGVGLGLAVAKGFLEAMGGEIEADDTPGGGLTIVARLRVAE